MSLQVLRIDPAAKTLGADFYLPKGSRRPPLLSLRLFDPAASKLGIDTQQQADANDASPNGVARSGRAAQRGQAQSRVCVGRWEPIDAVAATEVRLEERDGVQEAVLPYAVEGKDGVTKVKKVTVRFTHSIASIAGEEICGRLSRFGVLRG